LSALTGQFGTSVFLVFVTVVVSLLVAGWAGRRASRNGASGTRAAIRVLAIGAAVAIVVATALPQAWPPRFSGDGDLVLELGRGGLSDWPSIFESPTSTTSVLLLANVILYMPFGFLGVLGWPDHALRVVAAGLGISLLVEISHFTITERVASTDDVLLNTAGLLLGWVLGLVAGKVLARRTASREATGQVDLRGPDALPDA
jgi:hypothetical protein